MQRRAVITGAGVLCSIGSCVTEFWSNCRNGHSVVVPVPQHWHDYSSYRSNIWSPLPELDFAALGFSRTQIVQTDTVSLMTLSTAHEAIENAGLTVTPSNAQAGQFVVNSMDGARIGVYMGTGIGGANTFMENHYHQILARHKSTLAELASSEELATGLREKLCAVLDRMYHLRRINPFMVSRLMPNAVAANLGIHFSISGPNETFCLACASGTASVGAAFRAVRDGTVDIALTGGSEYLNDHYGYLFRAFDVAGVLAVGDGSNIDAANCPFDERRTGFLFSPGASVVLVVEELEKAKARGAPILAEIIGYGQSFDAHSMMAMEPSGAQIERMIFSVLRDAGIGTEEVDYVNAHGTGTQKNDEIECRVLQRVFGCDVLVNSTKSLVGHSIGASGALEILVTALSLRDQTTHICRNLENPISDLNFVQKSEKYSLKIGFSESFAFGGHNAAIALRRYQA